MFTAANVSQKKIFSTKKVDTFVPLESIYTDILVHSCCRPSATLVPAA